MARGLYALKEDRWWELARACPQATFFHTPPWARLIARTYRQYRDRSVGFCVDGVEGFVPLLRCRNRLGMRVLKSSFAGCYGGAVWVGEDGDDDHPPSGLYPRLLRGYSARLQLTESPMCAPIEHPPETAVEDDFTDIIALDRSFDEIFAGFSKGHRSSTKKGQRLGVTVSQGHDLEDFRLYYRVYQDSLRRWGQRASSHYSWGFFRVMSELAARHPEMIRLWLAEVEDEVVAGAVVFYWNRHVDWWHGAALEEFFDYCAVNVLQAEIIADAVARGFEFYDLNPSGGHEGVAAFKRRFGSTRHPVRRVVYPGLGDRLRFRVKGIIGR